METFNNMKKLIFALFALFTLLAFACQKQEVDCDNYRSHCKYIQFSYSDCTQNGSELGWKWDHIYSDTTEFDVWGCPERIEADFQKGLSDQGSESLKKFNQEYPSTCDCE
jgi:hypothetical protein